MEVIAKSKYVRISARKMRLVADLVRGLKVNEALEILSHLNKKPAQVLLLSLKQGIGNAVNNFGLQKDNLLIKKLEIGKGPTYKRGRAVSRGRWHPILKRTSHVRMILEGETKKLVKKPVKKRVVKKNGSKN
ncbi:50S ribosomal protein L22 [Candidatus Shapirobacteria bacterium CG10_big_fil_rev_8_21_14_0_10_38_14]|uniref:Large ribosomal subunit protein uL22 n=1 Tax=Candidatus Shapirobacteria bacterium CG10_big_fil_rev_8_21_14_0_10_38_14 TaxID=1974483 RepID=A0A2M8L5V2_9BACT|nr:MAG: 50S ribosomal protein L22 [Candidatus Shapirobacteria bacterium CG10_big_fil_rev_8_21_14_0_10_38_14]